MSLKLNKGVFFGHSARLGYDKCYYEDRLSESVGPLLYRLNPNQIDSCSACLSVFGPRGSHNGYGDSTTVGHTTAPAQDLVDVESVLSNRNVVASSCKDGKVNDIDVNKFQLQHARTCNDFLDPIASHLTNPPQNYREIGLNRFYNLDRNPQINIFWDFAVNTQLEAKDNYREKVPKLALNEPVLPRELKGRTKPLNFPSGFNCPK